MKRLVRHPDLVLWWSRAGPVVRNLESGQTLLGDSLIVAVLGAFGRPQTASEVLKSLPGSDIPATRSRLRLLRRLGFLLPESEARRKRSRIEVWRGNVASALHHSASRDLRYLSTVRDVESVARKRVLSRRRPALSKHYAAKKRIALPPAASAGADLEATLQVRRTVRRFRGEAVSLADLGALIRGTWGRTGAHDGGVFGSLLTKTSPSAGSLHPIECYVLAWNVRDLEPGLYHFDVGSSELRRLRRGRYRAQAVRAASGQAWVGDAAFLCIMTAVASRSLWKYDDEVTYRTLWLDAGHLAQTFCLLATARGLGPFTTAAIQDSFIENLIGLDGVEEFPLYLCGAGVPGRMTGPARK